MTRDLAGLTPRQIKMLQFIEEFATKEGYPPTLVEIGNTIGTTSTGVVHRNLKILERKGYLHRDERKARSLRVLPQSPSATHEE